MMAWLPTPAAHFLAVLLALLAYVLTTRAERERRSPAAAIGWVLGMVFLPYLVFPLYFFVGRRKLARTQPQRAAPPPAGAHWAQVLLAGFGLPPAAPARIELHRDGLAALAALWRLIESAQQRLDLCSYLLGRDALAAELAERLLARARAGVQVRLLLDAYGAFRSERALLDRLRAGGVAVALFRPLSLRYSDGPRNLRNHRKLAIADSWRLWSGGRNLAAEYFAGADGQPPWIDLSFDLEGATAFVAAAQFEADWAIVQHPAAAPSWPRIEAEAAALAPPAGADGLAQLLPSGPEQAEDTYRALLLEGCYRATRRILAVTPYFVPDEGLQTALRLAARRGVAITLVLPQRSNHRLADFARNRCLRELEALGVAIRLLPGMVHAKAVVLDHDLATLGSANLDPRSLLLNHEVMTLLYGSAQVEWLAGWLEALAASGQPYRKQRPGLLRDLGEGLVLTLAFQM